jgi:hypothetical protein
MPPCTRPPPHPPPPRLPPSPYPRPLDPPPLLRASYGTFAAGLADVSLVHSLLDIVPSGRDETGPGKRNMWWVKHKEDY